MAAKVAPTAHGSDRDSIFHSVFPKQNFTTPTPQATPNIASTSSGQSFGGFNLASDAANDAARSARAWSSATRYLTLAPGADGRPPQMDNDVLVAFSTLLGSIATRQNLVDWYKNQISNHIKAFVVPELQAWRNPIPISEATQVLQTTVQVLHHAQKHYLERLSQLLHTFSSQSLDGELHRNMVKFCNMIKQGIHTLVLHSLSRQRLQKTLASILFQEMVASIKRNQNSERCNKQGRCYCQPSLATVPLQQMCEVGLGGGEGERAFAHALHKFLERPAIERRCFAVDWTGHTSAVPKLRLWVDDCLIPFVQQTLGAITGTPGIELKQTEEEQFSRMAVSNMGRLRVHALFDYVKTWPASTGAIMDIWEYLNAGAPADKAFVCQSFSESMQKRLLHAGAMTADVLSIYINVIHTFNALDSRGVLLEKVAVPIRNYLRSRDDTVSIIAASFLADVDQDGKVTAADMDKICSDITTAVADSALQDNRDNKSLNWDDMNWMPDPIDAGPEYKSSKSEDIISYVLGNLFEPEEFIKEVTNVLAQHLLHTMDSEYVKETRLIELFKSRLDATKLQAAEVMLKDVRDSVSLGKRINPNANYESATQTAPSPREIQSAIPEEGITLSALYSMFETRISRPQFVAAAKLVATKRDDLFYPKRTRLPLERPTSSRKDDMNFKAQILSSYFWPQLRSNEFRLPGDVEPFRETFETNFEKLGSQRKLHFRPALARISIKLELEDRVIEEKDVPGWRASVIDAFASERKQPESTIIYDDAVGLTVEQLMEQLHMEEDLVNDALSFWTGKNVLYQREPGTYAVLERLDMDVGAFQQGAQSQQANAISAVKSEKSLLQESALTFEAFILNMLKNQGAKEIGGMMGITGLLKMVLPSFTYGDDEVRWLLGEMEKKGQVRREGEKWIAL